MRGKNSIEEALASLAMSAESREHLRRACEYSECRLQVEKPLAASIHEGGKIWRVPSDGSRWMDLGGNK
eukprot:2913180-Karenia_brevis.AAC.1